VSRPFSKLPEGPGRRGAVRLAVALATTLASLCLLAPVASATDGHGIYGETTDKIVTLAGFCLIGFFTVFVCVMSLITGRLEHRKEARKATEATLSDDRWRGGW
jgi:ABC-type nickel/cobalt efflux system permease component RcnA